MANRAWLVSALGSVRTYGGNEGYDDYPEATYRWDSNVPNSSKPAAGDFIVVRDKFVSTGVSVIEKINLSAGVKTLRYCPVLKCKASDINERKSKSPKYRCSKCKGEFEIPVTRVVEVTKYAAHYDAAWMDLREVFTSRELLLMCEDPGAQFSIREINWQEFASAVVARTGKQLSKAVERRHDAITGGHAVSTTRIRRGQNSFRQALLNEYGAVCALTGPAPAEVLDAAHLY